jgi:protein involved in polysaccharide export with SLBB domain
MVRQSVFILIIGIILWGFPARTLAQQSKNVYPRNAARFEVKQKSTAAQASAGASESTSVEAAITPLEVFGHNLFQNQPTVGEAIPDGAMPSNYRLGPGDQLGIYLGGKAQQHFEVQVGVDGQIYLPTVGIFNISALTIPEFSEMLDKRLRSYYSNYSIDIMLIQPKRVRVSVVGEVKAPGNYMLSAFGTVLDAIVSVDGPTERGSLRNIQVFRKDSLVARIDLYNFLLEPVGRHDFSLQNGDRIFVPIAQALVSITGEIKRAAIYELNPGKTETIGDLIDLAGGMTDTAYRDRVELSRLGEDGKRSIYFIQCGQVASPDMRILKNNDRIHIYSIIDQVPRQVVTIHGEVNHPDEYEYEQGMRLSDLILKAGSLTRSAYMLEAEVAKVDPQEPVRSIKVSLEGIFSQPQSDQDILLEADDHVFIRRIPEWQVGPLVEVSGEVMFPGFYPITRDSTTLSQVLEAAGGFTEDALVSEAKLIRLREVVPEDREFERLKMMTREEMSNSEYEYFVMKQNTEDVREIVVDFYKLMYQGDRSEDVLLEEGDKILVPNRPDVVYVSGRVSKPGGVLYKPGADLKYYVKKAGGFTWDASKGRTKVIKVTGETLDDEDVKVFKAGDRIWVPRKMDIHYWQILRDIILVTGQVATIYLVIQNASK